MLSILVIVSFVGVISGFMCFALCRVAQQSDDRAARLLDADHQLRSEEIF